MSDCLNLFLPKKYLSSTYKWLEIRSYSGFALHRYFTFKKKKIGKMSINNWFWLNYKIPSLLMSYTTTSSNKWVKNIFYVNSFRINSQFHIPETLQKLANYCGQIWLISFIYSPLFNNLLKTYLSSQLITALLIYKSIC